MSDDVSDLEAFLQSARTLEEVNQVDKREMLLRLESTLGIAAAAPPAEASGASMQVASASRLGFLKLAAVAAISFATGAMVHRIAASSSRQSTQVIASAPIVITVHSPPTILLQPTLVASAYRAPSEMKKTDAVAPSHSTLDAERMLLETARVALTRADLVNARAALAQYRARFPTGQLRQECASLQSVADAMRTGNAP